MLNSFLLTFHPARQVAVLTPRIAALFNAPLTRRRKFQRCTQNLDPLSNANSAEIETKRFYHS